MKPVIVINALQRKSSRFILKNEFTYCDINVFYQNYFLESIEQTR